MSTSPATPISPALEERLKTSARQLHRAAEDRATGALAALRKIPKLSRLDDDALTARLQRRHALSAVAMKLGFHGWQHFVAAFRGETFEDPGTLFHPGRGGTYWHIWSADYDEARRIREEHGGYLLPYKTQFFIVDAHYVRILGLDPDDAAFSAVGRDLARPADIEAWRALSEQVGHRRLDGEVADGRCPAAHERSAKRLADRAPPTRQSGARPASEESLPGHHLPVVAADGSCVEGRERRPT